jgi:hypothetical protein
MEFVIRHCVIFVNYIHVYNGLEPTAGQYGGKCVYPYITMSFSIALEKSDDNRIQN